MATNHPNSIAAIVGGRSSLDGKRCVDALNREWEIHTRHSGCDLEGKNVEAQIPYWTCYFIALDGLRLIENPWAKSRIDERPTLLEELLRLSAQHGDLFRDEKFGLLWLANVSEFGLSLTGYDDNHSMPQQGLGILSFGRLDRLSSQTQRDVRKELLI
jgi:hypothetical protein